MSQTILRPDADEALADFFKSQLPRPWPAAPVPAAAHTVPAASRREDQGSRARYTLAASVALLLGTCWFLSNGSTTTDRRTSVPGPGGGPNVLPDSSATLPKEFEKNREEKAKKTNDPMAGFQPAKIQLP